jgi:hypothetical protein
MGAGQISLPYEGIVKQRVHKLLACFEIISTAYTLDPGDYFLRAKERPEYLYQ